MLEYKVPMSADYMCAAHRMPKYVRALRDERNLKQSLFLNPEFCSIHLYTYIHLSDLWTICIT